ncbi:MAG: hypothetical protein KJ923_05870, partial [Candidatus Omnitrophica bacterium]|nr:hypothetical protein [Candidatus Omnitrophota bacterium]
AITIFATSEEHLARWEEILATSQKLNEYDISTILNIAKRVINRVPFSADIAGPNLSGVAELYQRLIRISIDTIQRLLTQLENYDEEKKLYLKTQELMEITRYCLEYRFAMNFISNIELISSYRLAPDHWAERSHLGRILRGIWGFEWEARHSEKALAEQLDKIIQRGNQIEPHLYNRPEIIRGNFEQYIKSIKLVPRVELGIRRPWRAGRIIRRTLPLVVTFLSAFIILWGWQEGKTTTLNFWNLIKVFASGAGIAVVVHWMIIKVGRGDPFYSTNKQSLKKLQERLDFTLRARYPVIQDYKLEMIREEYRKVKEALNTEINQKESSVDAILVMTGKHAERKSHLE